MLLISKEVKLQFQSKDDRDLLIKSMRKYSSLVRYGIKTLKPQYDDEKKVYKILNEKFPSLPARTISLAVKQDVSATINSFDGLEAKKFPLTERFDKDNSEFFVDGDKVKLKLAIDRPQKGKLTWITVDVMPSRDLKYKYYRMLFSSKKGYKLPSRLIMRNGQIYDKISVEREKLLATLTKPHINVGIDLNAFWIGKREVGNPLAVAFINDDGTFARQPQLIHEWAEIPKLIRTNQRNKTKMKKVVKNHLGIIVKKILDLVKDYQSTFKLEDLTGLNKIKGAYSKFFYKKFLEVLETKSLDIELVDPSYTSQTCSRCGKLGQTNGRTFYCSTCYPKGFHRDINASINIAKRNAK